MSARILDDINEFVHEKFIPEKTKRTPLSRAERNSRTISWLMGILGIGGIILSIILTALVSLFFLTGIPVSIGTALLIGWFGDWYDEKYDV